MSVHRETVVVNSENGLHLVPCSRIASIAKQYENCDVQVSKDERSADAKTILELMTLNAEKGTTLVLEACGDGAGEAIGQLVELFRSNFEADD